MSLHLGDAATAELVVTDVLAIVEPGSADQVYALLLMVIVGLQGQAWCSRDGRRAGFVSDHRLLGGDGRVGRLAVSEAGRGGQRPSLPRRRNPDQVHHWLSVMKQYRPQRSGSAHSSSDRPDAMGAAASCYEGQMP